MYYTYILLVLYNGIILLLLTFYTSLIFFSQVSSYGYTSLFIMIAHSIHMDEMYKLFNYSSSVSANLRL